MAENVDQPQAAEPNGLNQANGPKKCLIRFGNMLKGGRFISGQTLAGNRRSNKALNGTQAQTLANNNNQLSATSSSQQTAVELNTIAARKQNYFLDCHRAYSCIHCGAHLANHDELISKLFQGNHGRAYLFNKVTNISCKQAVQRELLTGLHAVADIYCDNCETTVGWKYEQAFVPSQKYKEGKYIIELVHILKENNWDLTSYNVKALLDEAQLSMMKLAQEEETRLREHERQRQLKHRYNQYTRNNCSHKRYNGNGNSRYDRVRLNQPSLATLASTSRCNFNKYNSTSCMDFHSDDNKAAMLDNNEKEIGIGSTTENTIGLVDDTTVAAQQLNKQSSSEPTGDKSEALDRCDNNQPNSNGDDAQPERDQIVKVEPMIELKVCKLNQSSELQPNLECDVNETTTVLIIGANNSINNSNCSNNNINSSTISASDITIESNDPNHV